MAASKLLASRPEVIVLAGDVLVYRSNYRIQPPVGGVADGTVDLPFDENKTESEISADMAEAIAAHANLQTSMTDFLSTDVIGGRL
jgi:hypothetical protein